MLNLFSISDNFLRKKYGFFAYRFAREYSTCLTAVVHINICTDYPEDDDGITELCLKELLSKKNGQASKVDWQVTSVLRMHCETGGFQG